MFRLALPTAFVTLLTLPAMAQQADPTPAPPTPEAQTSPDPVPLPVMPAGGAGCDRTKQRTS